MGFRIAILFILLSSITLAVPQIFVHEQRDFLTISRSVITPTTATTKHTVRTAILFAERSDHFTRTPTSTLSSTSITGATSSSTVIPTKSGIGGCNLQGTANDLLKTNQWDTARASDVLICQKKCMNISQCMSYSFQGPSTTKDDNCIFYHMFIGKGVVPTKTSGIYFSNKYPTDGTNFCYGSVPL